MPLHVIIKILKYKALRHEHGIKTEIKGPVCKMLALTPPVGKVTVASEDIVSPTTATTGGISGASSDEVKVLTMFR